MTDDKREWWIYPQKGPTSTAYAKPNISANVELVHVVPASTLLKWKSRCASLTAEVLCLRQSIAFQACENWPMSITCFDEANRIKAEREAAILSDEAQASTQITEK